MRDRAQLPPGEYEETVGNCQSQVAKVRDEGFIEKFEKGKNRNVPCRCDGGDVNGDRPFRIVGVMMVNCIFRSICVLFLLIIMK